MALLYADEQFPLPVVELLRAFGHNVLTVQEAGKANLGIPDPEVLEFAITNDRAVLILNRFDFIGLHNRKPDHAGIIVCTKNRNVEMLATRINEAISMEDTLRGKLIRVNRPPQ